ncbi:hypothetical protein Vadar_005558 [Vaccinium darrowii]|uniref:Uncharacterized protein n=1 Tax=Vaccinium darrowii TaxID=229202 RepID=A0ACB7YU94_9ERIC|nr:hypothetical protein Vadar_005558 [Vaccinium darrowii]
MASIDDDDGNDTDDGGKLKWAMALLLPGSIYMEHFDGVEDRVSICIDENKIPVPESDDDSFYSLVFKEYGAFKSNGLTDIEDGYKMIKGCIAQGMGKDVNNAPSLSPAQIKPHISESILKQTQEIWIDNHLTDNLCNLIFSRRFYTHLHYHHIPPVFVHGKRNITPCQFLQHTCRSK